MSWPVKKRNKYNNTKCEFGGFKFDSKKELKRYHELKAMEFQGLIQFVEPHPKMDLVLPDGTPIIIRGQKRNTKARYTPDFRYIENGKEVFEDVKSLGTMTEASKLRIAVFEAIYKTEVRIT